MGMSDGPYYIVKIGTNKRWCFDHRNKQPKVYDTEEAALEELAFFREISATRRGAIHVPILVECYNKKYSKFEEQSDETTTNHPNTGK